MNPPRPEVSLLGSSCGGAPDACYVPLMSARSLGAVSSGSSSWGHAETTRPTGNGDDAGPNGQLAADASVVDTGAPDAPRTSSAICRRTSSTRATARSPKARTSLQHHKHANRDGLYVDAKLTKAPSRRCIATRRSTRPSWGQPTRSRST